MMVVDIELTRQADGHYVARAFYLPEIVVEAATRDAALEQMRAALLARRRAGVEVVQLDLGDLDEPPSAEWPRHAGAFADDAAYQEMLAEVERERHQIDQGHTA
jgi:hypothetical protein